MIIQIACHTLAACRPTPLKVVERIITVWNKKAMVEMTQGSYMEITMHTRTLGQYGQELQQIANWTTPVQHGYLVCILQMEATVAMGMHAA